MFKRVAVIIVIFIIVVNLNSYDLKELSYIVKNNEIQIEIFINQKHVNPNEYLNSLNTKNKSLLSDGTICESTVFIDSFYVKWPDKKVIVPADLYEDCDDLRLRTAKEVILSDDNESIIFRISGSDGGGTYDVYFIVSKNGEISRFTHLYDYQFTNEIEFNLKNIEKSKL